MAQIIPTILTADPEEYKKRIMTYQPFAKRIQVDVSDGTLVPSLTIPLNTVWWPQGWETDIHLMSAKPSEHMPVILQLKPTLCIFHAETEEDLVPLFEQLKSAGIRAGVALQKKTFPGSVKRYIEAADHVMIFAGELGKQGSQADMLQTEKVTLIEQINPNCEIGWDGGANIKNVRAIAHAGVDAINVGSALSQAADPSATFEELTSELDKRGVVL